ncbi:MAG: VOC family protein [Cyanobacteria bacterium P01_A01_bin.37]
MTFRCKEAFIALAAEDFERIVGFYTQVFECEPQPYLANRYAEFRLPGVKLGVFKPTASHSPEFAAPAYSGWSLCIEVDDLDGAIAHIRNLGYAPPRSITTASHGREAYAYDPAGNRLILHESLE